MNRTVRSGVLAATAWAALTGLTGCGQDAASPASEPRRVTAPAAPRTAAALGPVGTPGRVVIPAIGVDEGLYGVGLKADGAMQTPEFGDAGWYDLGPRPGAPGPAVIVAHVHGPAGDDVFARLHELRTGDVVRVTHSRGSAAFVVDAVELVRKDALPYERIWARTERRLLRLITCGGTPDPVSRTYPDNTIVYAHRVA